MNPDTRSRLIELSIELMRQQGFHATGLNQLLKLAKVPKGSFYHYFDSKEQLGLAIIEQYGHQLAADLRQFIEQAQGSHLDRLRQYFEFAYHWLSQHPDQCNCLLGTLAQELSQAHPELRQALSQQYQRIEQQLAYVLQQAQAEQALSAQQDAQQMARLLFSGWQGCLTRSRLEQSSQALQEFISLYFERLLATAASD